jgi:hypothetical protein
MMAEPDAHTLVSAARDVMRLDNPALSGLWPRAAAMLGRQALEAAMTRVWELTAPGMDRMSFRCQVLCIGPMLNDAVLGGRIIAAWSSLSGACHHGIYDVPPSAVELTGTLETVLALATAADRLRTAVRAEDDRGMIRSLPL